MKAQGNYNQSAATNDTDIISISRFFSASPTIGPFQSEFVDWVLVGLHHSSFFLSAARPPQCCCEMFGRGHARHERERRGIVDGLWQNQERDPSLFLTHTSTLQVQ